MNEKIVLGIVHVYDLIIDNTISSDNYLGTGTTLAGAVLAMGVHGMGHRNVDYHNLLDTLTSRSNAVDKNPEGNHFTTPKSLRPKDTAIFDALLMIDHYKKHIKVINGVSYFSMRSINPKMRNEFIWDGFRLTGKTDLMRVIKHHNFSIYLGPDFNLHIFDPANHIPEDTYELAEGISLVVHHE